MLRAAHDVWWPLDFIGCCSELACVALATVPPFSFLPWQFLYSNQQGRSENNPHCWVGGIEVQTNSAFRNRPANTPLCGHSFTIDTHIPATNTRLSQAFWVPCPYLESCSMQSERSPGGRLAMSTSKKHRLLGTSNALQTDPKQLFYLAYVLLWSQILVAYVLTIVTVLIM